MTDRKPCVCDESTPCGCGNQADGPHCMYCCGDLTQEFVDKYNWEQAETDSMHGEELYTVDFDLLVELCP